MNEIIILRFGVTPVYRVALGGYSAEFGCKYDGLLFEYSKYPATDKIYIIVLKKSWKGNK